MDRLTRQVENEEFQKWWLKNGKYSISTYKGKYWAWKAWEERASKMYKVSRQCFEDETYINS